MIIIIIIIIIIVTIILVIITLKCYLELNFDTNNMRAFSMLKLCATVKCVSVFVTTLPNCGINNSRDCLRLILSELRN